jgi:Tol biopolymer transport system component
VCAVRRILAVLLLIAALVSPTAASAAFPGKNGRIAFTREGDIWTVRPVGAEPLQLTAGPERDWAPSWAPGGNRLAFVRGRGAGAEIYVVDANGENLRRITLNDVFDGDPAWSPGGGQIVFTSDRASGSTPECEVSYCGPSIFLMGAAGRHVRQLTEPRVLVEFGRPTFSPDGTRIAFYAWLDFNGAVGVMRDDGSDLRFVGSYEQELGDADLYPAWSPDGSALVFTWMRDPTGAATDFDFGLSVMSPDGLGERAVVASAPAETSAFSWPAWSPNGLAVAYERAGAIHVVQANGSADRFVATGSQPDWSVR